MLIALTPNQAAFLRDATFVPAHLARQLKQASSRFEKSIVVELSDEDADSFRDLLGEQLQLIGFDESYNPTPEGALLEQLIDKSLLDSFRLSGT